MYSGETLTQALKERTANSSTKNSTAYEENTQKLWNFVPQELTKIEVFKKVITKI